MAINLETAFARLEAATSIADLRALINDVDAKVTGLAGPVTLQLYAGATASGDAMFDVVKNLNGAITPDGTHLITVDQTDLGILLSENNLFFRKLDAIVKETLHNSANSVFEMSVL